MGNTQIETSHLEKPKEVATPGQEGSSLVSLNDMSKFHDLKGDHKDHHLHTDKDGSLHFGCPEAFKDKDNKESNEIKLLTTDVQQLQTELTELQAELKNLQPSDITPGAPPATTGGDSGAGATTPSGGDTPPTKQPTDTNPGSSGPTDTTPAAPQPPESSNPTATSPSDGATTKPPTDSSTGSGSSTTTDAPPPVTNPTSSAPSTTDGGDTNSTTRGNSATGPDGKAVGSTATDFGISAMPEVNAAAPAFYVSADGSANGNGSADQPFATLQQAQKAMENSDIKTTYIEGGTYTTPLNLTSADSGESFIGIGSTTNAATLDGGGTTGSLINLNGADNVTVEGMKLQNTQQDLWSYKNADAAVTANNSTGDNFSYNTISNVGEAYNLGGVSNSKFNGNDISDVQQAIAMNPGSSGNTIDSNSITNVSNLTGGNDAGAINLDAATDNMISNNVIQNTAEAGIELENWGGVSPNGNSILGNTVIDANTAAKPSSTYDATGSNPSDMGAIYAWQGAGNASDNMNLTISGNYVKNAGAGFENVGIYLDDGVSGATVTGNIVQGGGSGWDMLVHGGSNDTLENNVLDLTSSTGKERGILMQSDGPQMDNDTISKNIFYANGANGGAYTDYSGPASNIPKTITDNVYSGVSQSFDSSPVNGDAVFTNPTDGDYSLQAGSPITGF